MLPYAWNWFSQLPIGSTPSMMKIFAVDVELFVDLNFFAYLILRLYGSGYDYMITWLWLHYDCENHNTRIYTIYTLLMISLRYNFFCAKSLIKIQVISELMPKFYLNTLMRRPFMDFTKLRGLFEKFWINFLRKSRFKGSLLEGEAAFRKMFSKLLRFIPIAL